MALCCKVLFAVYLLSLTNNVNSQQTGFPIRGLEQRDNASANFAPTTNASSDDEESSGAATTVKVTTSAPTTQATTAIVTTQAATTAIATTLPDTTTVEATQVATTTIATTLPPATTVEATKAATTPIATTRPDPTTVEATQAATTTIATTLPPATTAEATKAATTTIATTLPPTTIAETTQAATTTIATTLPPTTIAETTQAATTTIATTQPPTTTEKVTQAPTTTIATTVEATQAAITTADPTQAATTTIVNTQGTTTTVTTALCFEDNTAWLPMDMANTIESIEQDEYACQNKCAKQIGCVHFTMGKQLRDCHLQDAYASRQENDVASISGPFLCWEGIKSHLGEQQEDFVDVGNYTYLEKAISCLTMGFVYTPIMVGGGPFYMDSQGRTSGRNEAPGRAAIQQCEDKCSAVEGCTHFTVQFQEIATSTPLCRLADANAHPTPMEGSVSGPRGGCSPADDTQEKFDASEGQLQTGWHRTAYGIAPGRDGASILAVAACIMVTLGAVGAYSARLLRRPRQATQLARQPKNAAGRLQEREALLTLELA